MQSRWHPSRLWIGYASYAGRFAMPLAKFFYGKTHKWYFRSTAAVLVASYVTAVAAHFDDKHRWILYLIAFGAVSAVYWLVYAPAKWVQSDIVKDSHSRGDSRLVYENADAGHKYADELLHPQVQAILHNGAASEPPDVPVEVRVLHYYLMDRGRSAENGPYRHTRQWAPPGFWRGHKEYGTFAGTASDEALEESDFPPGVITSGIWEQERKRQLGELTRSVQYLDRHSPRWRKKAQRWDNGGWAGIAGGGLQKHAYRALARIRRTGFVKRP